MSQYQREDRIKKYAEMHPEEAVLSPNKIARALDHYTGREVSQSLSGMGFDRVDDSKWRNPYAL